MRLICFIISITASVQLFSQSKYDELFQNLDTVKSISELESGKNKYRVAKELDEYLNLEIVQTNWFLYRGRKSLGLRLMTLSIRDTVFYKEYFKPKVNTDFDGYVFDVEHNYVDSLLLAEINTRSIGSLGKKINVNQLERSPNRSIFGLTCGGGAEMPDEGQRMLDLIIQKDTIELTNWIKSISPVKQAYSYLGFKLLQSKDSFKTPDEILNLMRELENSSRTIYSCYGCTFWEYEAIKSLLNKKDTDKFIERYSNRK